MSKLILLLLILLSPVSFAKRKRAKTVGDVLKQIDAQSSVQQNYQKKRTTIPVAKPKKNVSPKNISAVKPPRLNKLLRNSKTPESELERATDASINELFKLTQKYKKSPQRGELWLRLGELYVEKSKLIEYRVYDKYDQELKEYYAKKRKRLPKLNLNEAREYNKRAIKLYAWFLRDFPNDPKSDQAIFFLGYNYFQLGKVKKGAKFYEELASKYGSSKFVVESNFALGEYYYDNSKWKKAISAYSRVLKFKRNRLYNFALYKIAWSQYKSGQVKIGIRNLEKVIKLSRTTNSSDKIRLASEASKDIVPFYALYGKASQAREYFINLVGEKRINEQMEQLGYLYIRDGKRGSARIVFKDLISRRPNNKKNGEFQYQIVNAYSTGGSKKIFLNELNIWLSQFGSGSGWAAKNQVQASTNIDLQERFIRNYALQVHQTAQNTRILKVQKEAANAYQLFLSNFPNSDYAGEMSFFYGELLYDMKRYDSAYVQYANVADNYKNSKYRAKAANNALLAIERDLPSYKEIEKQVGKNKNKFPLPSSVKRFIAAAEKYNKEVKDKNRRVETEFRVGRLYYSYNHFDEAEQIFQKIVKNYPKTKYSEFSANLILDIYNIKGDYAGLEKAGQGLIQNPQLQSQKVRGQVKSFVEKAAFKQAQDLESTKDYKKSADAFAGFAKKYPNSKLYDSAIFNAGVNYERSGELLLALPLYGKVLRSKDPNIAKQKESTRLLLANLNQQIGRYDEAAKGFESYANRNKKDPKRADIYFNAALIWRALNNYKRAIQNYEDYYKNSRKIEKVNALFEVGNIYEEQGSYRSAESYYKRFIAESPKNSELRSEAIYKIAKMNERSNKALPWYKRLIKDYPRSQGKTIRFVAEAKFNLIDQEYQRYLSIRIPADPKAQASALKQKIDLLAKLNEEYQKVISLDSGPQVISSLTNLGNSYEHLAKAIERAPKPSNLTPEQLKQYNENLSKLIVPRRNTAIEFYKKATAKSAELEILSDYTRIARRELAKLQPQENTYWQDYTISEPLVNLRDI